ncbi:MAG: ABC transporter ATP-binding protein [Firmicutes bacterium HGW-Firmicutes-1]|jgi:ABC-2 type transport system ATP-binding protein|nr:MAG: ABC transporter ATP-binding protein [Firmicutes bacterium HGW-Firmicutes-1]
MIKVENLVKRYGKFTAVDSLSFSIGKGEIFGFVGSNGAGKTTTMKVAAGLLKADQGTIFINGFDVHKQRREAKRCIGYMPDFFGVYDDLKVTEYMNFYCGVHKIPVADRSKTIDSLVELVNLTDKKESYVDDLSRGMKQRLCLARSLIHNPDLLILDEPASGLDPRARVEFREILKELKDMGKTVLISSHILHELSEVCTSIGIIDGGKMIAIGTVAEIQEKLNHLSRVKVKVCSDFSLAASILKEQPQVTGIVEANGYIEFSFAGEIQQKADLLKTLVDKQVRVTHFEETAGSLESIFMHLTEAGEEQK